MDSHNIFRLLLQLIDYVSWGNIGHKKKVEHKEAKILA